LFIYIFIYFILGGLSDTWATIHQRGISGRKRGGVGKNTAAGFKQQKDPYGGLTSSHLGCAQFAGGGRRLRAGRIR
jgi:hypothetical protein